MASTLLLTLAFAVAGCTGAADFTGRWAGTATNGEGVAVPVWLTITQHDDVVSGHILRDGNNESPLTDVVTRDDEMSFRLRDTGADSAAEFRLKFVTFGRPPGDPQVALRGTSITGRHQSSVDMYPVQDDIVGSNGIDIGPVLAHRVEPVYTEEARQANVQGAVLLRVDIQPTGLVSKERIRVLRSLGHGLDEAAVKSVGQWRFRPAFRNGWAVESVISIEVGFRL